jgi:nitric oxide reductase subunit B
VHGHAALFGVYGMLGIGLTLVCLRASNPHQAWPENWLRVGFWSMNLGLFGMCVVSLLPLGLIQTWAAVDQGYWYARSAEFMNTPVLDLIRWLRVPGDTLFAVGAVAIALFILKQTLPGMFGRGECEGGTSPRERSEGPVVNARGG